MSEFDWSHDSEEIDLVATIDWSHPVTHDMLNTGLASSDDTAYFYSIIGLSDQEWWPYYIGKVYSQSISQRHKNSDHLKRIQKLKTMYPNVIWHITLGTLTFTDNKRINETLIDDLEGLLIYSNWHDESINKSKINNFSADRQIQITNTGFSDPFHSKIGYGVFVQE
jgi:hypothetical protein